MLTKYGIIDASIEMYSCTAAYLIKQTSHQGLNVPKLVSSWQITVVSYINMSKYLLKYVPF